MKISLVSPRYTFTGVALAQIRFAGALAGEGHDVTLLFGCLDPDHLPEEHRRLPRIPGVKVVDLQRSKVRGMLLPLWRHLREAKPDIVFSAEDHLNGVVLLAAILSRSKAKISGSSRVSPFDTYSNKPFTKKWLFKQLMRTVMWRADALTCVSEDMVDQYRTIFPRGPHLCVHNIIDDEPSRQRMLEPVDHEWFVRNEIPVIAAAGTLTVRKGFADLIRAVGLVRDRGRRVRLAIFGEGPLRPELEALIEELDLADSVWLPGRIDNVLKYFARAQVSALSSYAEGLPNVLVEAMICGCVPVSTDCPTGPREVLRDGRYGYLVPMHDPAAMATAIEQALDNPVPKEKLAEAVRSFEAKTVLRRHFQVLALADAD